MQRGEHGDPWGTPQLTFIRPTGFPSIHVSIALSVSQLSTHPMTVWCCKSIATTLCLEVKEKGGCHIRHDESTIHRRISHAITQAFWAFYLYLYFFPRRVLSNCHLVSEWADVLAAEAASCHSWFSKASLAYIKLRVSEWYSSAKEAWNAALEHWGATAAANEMR